MFFKGYKIASPGAIVVTVFILLAILLLSSCSGRSKFQEYYPHAEGESWEYSATIEMFLLGGVQEISVTTQIDGEEKINGKRYIKFITFSRDMSDIGTDITYTRYTKDGIYLIDADDPNQIEYLDTPFPLTEGQSWTVSNWNSNIEYHFEGFEDLPLADQIYKECLKFTFTGTLEGEFVEGEQYFAKDIGLVKETMDWGYMTITLELVEYQK